MADEQAMISEEQTVQGKQVDIDINIRDDDIQLFETETGRQLLRTPTMKENVYIEPVPTMNGFEPEIVVEPTITLVATESADPKEQPDVANAPMKNEIRLD